MRSASASPAAPRLRAAGAALLVLLPVVLACTGSEEPPPHVVLITVDTLRADHLEPYGSSTTRTPNATRLAAEGTLFEDAAAPMPLTRPSHSTLFTSRHPRSHGVTDNHLALPESELTLAEVLRDSGYRTGAFIGSSIVGRHSGVTQGFEHLESPDYREEPAAAQVVERAVQWLRTLDPEEPFFLWIHVFDPHLSYAPPEYFLPPPEPGGPSFTEVTWRSLRFLARRHGGEIDRRSFDRIQALYAAEVDSVDAALGLLLLELDERDLADRTLLALTADHGECFENGFFFRHGGCLYDGAVHVPLLFRYPGRLAAGERRAGQVRHQDVAPTLLTLAGIEVPERFEGKPLFRRNGAPEPLPDDRTALVQHPLSAERTARARSEVWDGIESVAGIEMRPSPRGGQQFALRSGAWKYIATTAGDEELYDLATDPAETRNVAPERREVVRRFRALLRQRIEELPLTVLDPGELTDELRQELEAHGYL